MRTAYMYQNNTRETSSFLQEPTQSLWCFLTE